MDKLDKEIKRFAGKLGECQLCEQCSRRCGRQEKAKLADAESAYAKLKEQLDKLSAI